MNFNQIKTAVLAQAETLAENSFHQFATQGVADTQAFLADSEATLKNALALLQQGKIDPDDFADAVKATSTLAEMNTLKQAGLASAKIDMFVSGVLQIFIDAALAAL